MGKQTADHLIFWASYILVFAVLWFLAKHPIEEISSQGHALFISACCAVFVSPMMLIFPRALADLYPKTAGKIASLKILCDAMAITLLFSPLLSEYWEPTSFQIRDTAPYLFLSPALMLSTAFVFTVFLVALVVPYLSKKTKAIFKKRSNPLN